MTQTASKNPINVRFVSLIRDEGEDTYSVHDIQEYAVPNDPVARRRAIMKHMRRFRDEAIEITGKTDLTAHKKRKIMIAAGEKLSKSLINMTEFNFDFTANYRLNVYFLPSA